MARKGLGKGLDSLIPNFYDEDFDSNSTQSLEDMLSADEEEKSVEEVVEDITEEVEENDPPAIEDKPTEEEIPEEKTEEENQEDDETSEELDSADESEESVSLEQDPQVLENVKEVKEIVDKNPRITLWSSRSAAVFRYLRKTEPEFSISKEASTIIDEAVSKKYPEIWELFEE